MKWQTRTKMTRTIDIAMHQLNYTTGDFEGNLLKTRESIISAIDADLHVLPECAVTNYPSDDLYLDAGYQAKIEEYCEKYRFLSAELNCAIVVGTPLRGKRHGKKMCNGLVVYRNGQEVHRYMKTHLPNYGTLDDARWFESRLEQIGKDAESGVVVLPVDGNGVRLGFCISEDIWFDDVTQELAFKGAEIIISINSSAYAVDMGNSRRDVFRDRVRETNVPLVYVNQVGGNDELVWDGCSAVLDPDGTLYEMEPGKEGVEVVTLFDAGRGYRNSVAKRTLVLTDPQERYLMAGLGLRDYIEKNGFAGVLFGLSGGADSTFVAALSVDVFGAQRVNTAMMPSPNTSTGSNSRAVRLAQGMAGGFNTEVWPITEQYEAHKALFQQVRKRDMARIADENLQAQLRGDILSAISNDHGNLAILGTSNKSEVLMGYGTLYGDMRGAFNPCKDLYKSIDIFPMLEMRLEQAHSPDPEFAHIWEQTFGHGLAEYTVDGTYAIRDVIDEPPSAELWPGQVDTDSLPPYPRLDAVLWQIEDAKVSMTDAEIAKLLGEPVEFVSMVRAKRKRPEYKRFQSPPGTKIHQKSPTAKDRRMPITSKFA